MSSKACVHIIS